MSTSNDDIVRELLFRDHIKVTLHVDADAARGLDDETIEAALSAEARRLRRDEIERFDEDGAR